LFKVSLKKIINLKHPLCVLGTTIKWSEFDNAFGPLYGGGSPFRGRVRADLPNRHA
jgi:hypothetical protein